MKLNSAVLLLLLVVSRCTAFLFPEQIDALQTIFNKMYPNINLEELLKGLGVNIPQTRTHTFLCGYFVDGTDRKVIHSVLLKAKQQDKDQVDSELELNTAVNGQEYTGFERFYIEPEFESAVNQWIREFYAIAAQPDKMKTKNDETEQFFQNPERSKKRKGIIDEKTVKMNDALIMGDYTSEDAMRIKFNMPDLQDGKKISEQLLYCTDTEVMTEGIGEAYLEAATKNQKTIPSFEKFDKGTHKDYFGKTGRKLFSSAEGGQNTSNEGAGSLAQEASKAPRGTKGASKSGF